MCAGTQEPLKEKLKEKLGDDKVGEMFCLGYCYENHAFHYDGQNYAGDDINKIDEIISGNDLEQEKFYSESFASTSFLMDDKLSDISKFKDHLKNIINTDKQEIIKSLLDSNLTGRGGAGFPTGMKWDFCSKAKGDKKYVICNADEGDSGAYSDRYLLEDQALKVIFGMVVCGYVIGSDEGVLYIRGEYPKSIESLNASINSLKKEGLLGDKVLGTDFSFDLGICIGQGAYICGEETALIASIEGRRAEVDVRPPFPVTEGLYKKPTVVNNVETLAAAAGILLNGAEKFSAIGNKKSAGTKLVCFDSFFNNPGVYEIEMGTPMKKVLYDIGGGFKEDIKALQIGGPLGGVIPIAEAEKLNLDFQEFTKAGFMLGHASIVSIPKDFPMVEYIHHLFEFTAEESCGKCFPGRLGSYRGKEMFDQLKSKKAKIPLKVLNDLLITMKKGCLCALCGAIPTPIMNILKYFGDEMKNDMVKEN
jgi:NADH-quinone oxidoreductase subunit F